MEPAAAVNLPAKRQAENPQTDSNPPLKKHITGLNKVAEIVLVLSAMSEIRGGRSPTQPEFDLMAEARAKLAKLFEKNLKPKDLVTKEAVESLIDDLGLNSKIKDQNVIVGPPKLSIADKLLQTKKKMEESAKEVNARLVAARSAVEASSTGYVHGPVSGTSRSISGVLNQPGKTTYTLPGAVKLHYGGPRPVTAGSSFDHGLKNPSTWSVQSQTLSFPRYVNDKIPLTSTSEGVMSRVTPQAHQSLQQTSTVQGVLPVGNHNDISKTVHKLLQKQVPERPTWTPPSRDYMNRVVMCQVCHHSISDVESLFLCDACEHAYHLKCLPSSNQKVVPRGEWHCPQCLQLSNGKLLPPKYGRVTRNVTAFKVPSKASSDQRASMQKARAVNPPSVITGSVASSTGPGKYYQKTDYNESSSIKDEIEPAKTATATQLTNVVTETSGHRAAINELSNLKEEMTTYVTGIGVTGPADNLSGHQL